jgi:hypothetical protein
MINKGLFTVEFTASWVVSVFIAAKEFTVWVELCPARTQGRRLVTKAPYNTVRPNRIYIVNLSVCGREHEGIVHSVNISVTMQCVSKG